MGSSASKPASRAAGAATKATRQYPSRPSAPTTSNPAAATNAPRQAPPPAANGRAGPTVHPQARASGQRNEAINLDASDPDFARSLRQLGAVQPNPTLSPSSTFNAHPSSHFPQPYGNASAASSPQGPSPRLNPALRVLEARAQLADEAEREFLEAGKRGSVGRRFLDIGTLRTVVTMRDQRGMSAAEIERVLGLKGGVVGRLGPKGVVGVEGILQDS